MTGKYERLTSSLGQIGDSDTRGEHRHELAEPSRQDAQNSTEVPSTPAPSPGVVGERVDVRVLVEWTGAGGVVIDAAGKPTFGLLPAAPGLYRLTFTGGPAQTRPRLYVGESDNLRRRLARNYRNPGSGQQTSLRISAALRAHLTGGGRVDLVIATAATAHVALPGREPAAFSLDLAVKAARLLAENAALVTAQLASDTDLENLP